MTAKSLRHKFQSLVPDDADASLVRPSNWNDDHDLWMGLREISAPTTADTLLPADHLSLLTYASGAGVVVTLPAALGSQPGWKCKLLNIGEGEVTVVPETTINGDTALFALSRGEMLEVFTNGTTDFRAIRIGGFKGGASAQALGGLLSYVSPTRLNFHRYMGGSIVHNAGIWPIPAGGLNIPNTNVLIDGTAGNLEPDMTYYLFVTDDGEDLIPNFIQQGPVGHAPSISEGNEGVEVLQRGDPLWDHVRFLIGNDNAPSGTDTFLEQRFGLPIGTLANVPANLPIYTDLTPPLGMRTSIRFPAGAVNVGGLLSVPQTGNNLTLGNQDFCIEGFWRPETSLANWLFHRGPAATGAGMIGMYFSTARLAQLRCPDLVAADSTVGSASAGALLSPAWNHFSICRYEGSRLYGTVNGHARRISNSVASIADAAQTGPFTIGHILNILGTSATGFQGAIGPWRLTIGNARYPEPDFLDLNANRIHDVTRVPMPFPVGPATLDDTQTLIGLVHTDANGQFVDNERQRFVASWFNRRPRGLRGRSTANNIGTTGNGPHVEGSPQRRVEFVTWESLISSAVIGRGWSGQTLPWTGGMMISLDATQNNMWQGFSTSRVGNGWAANMSNSGLAMASEGYHWITPVGWSNLQLNIEGNATAMLFI